MSAAKLSDIQDDVLQGLAADAMGQGQLRGRIHILLDYLRATVIGSQGLGGF
jgi:hypothetical protein